MRQISDIKRLNKIEKEIEIHARKTLKVPMNAHSLLLSTGTFELPAVHKSGQNSPKHVNNNTSGVGPTSQLEPSASRALDEKLLIASVSLAPNATHAPHANHVNDILFSTRVGGSSKDFEEDEAGEEGERQPLFDAVEEGRRPRTSPHAIRGAPKADLNCSGSDCDISWIVLLVLILALCFAIPLIYVIYIAEHPEQFHHNESVNAG